MKRKGDLFENISILSASEAREKATKICETNETNAMCLVVPDILKFLEVCINRAIEGGHTDCNVKLDSFSGTMRAIRICINELEALGYVCVLHIDSIINMDITW